MKIIRNKWLLFLLLILAFVLLEGEIRHVTMTQRGIVLGIGIDKESDEYIVTTEILAPSNLGAESYQKNRLLSVQRGKTLAEAFERMEKSIGVRISLKHTVLIVLGESVRVQGDYLPLVNLFMGNEVADDTYIIGAYGSAKDLFSAKPPMYRTISYKIAETFRSSDIESGVVSLSVKDFFKMSLEESHSIYIPMVEVDKGNMSESNGSLKDEETDSLVFGKISVLDNSGEKVILDGEESDGLSYVYSHVNEANLYVKGNGEVEDFDVDIIETKTDRALDIERKTINVRVTMWVKIGGTKSETHRGSKDPFMEQKKKLAGETIKKQVFSAYERCREKNVDILGIGTAIAKKKGKDFRSEYGEYYLDKIGVNIVVKLIVK